MCVRIAGVLCLVGLIACAVFSPVALAQKPAEAKDEAELKIPEIVDEPKTIDPAELMPAKLAKRASKDFSDSSLREVVDWLKDQQELVVLLDHSGLDDVGISPAEPISDRLDNAPLYLLLNRLRSLDLAWYFEDDILHITSVEVAQERANTLPYNVGDLLDAGYELDRLINVVSGTIEPESWEDVGGSGVLNSLGDVLFVRQNDEVQRQVQGLLTALRKHARQTFVNDPPQHLVLREKLNENVSVDFKDTPLETAVGQLAAKLKIDIRLDTPELRTLRIREREPVSLALTERKLETVLQAIVMDLELTWILRDGVLWITSQDAADSYFKTAVYDVRDLCGNEDESDALADAVTSQTQPSSWEEVGGPGSLAFVKPGTLVISHQERVHREVLNLLKTYRTALRASKPRDRDKEDPNEVLTIYYRMHENVARDISVHLLSLVRPDSWKSDAKPDAKGQVTLISSSPELPLLDEAASKSVAASPAAQPLFASRAVLVIQQTRAAHDEIAEVIRRIQSGDATSGIGGFGGGMGGGGTGGGMGGFGGSFFSVPTKAAAK